MKLGAHSPSHLTYCSNIHPGEGWAEVRANFDRHVLAVRDALAPEGRFGIGLRTRLHRLLQLGEIGRTLAALGLAVAHGLDVRALVDVDAAGDGDAAGEVPDRRFGGDVVHVVARAQHRPRRQVDDARTPRHAACRVAAEGEHRDRVDLVHATEIVGTDLKKAFDIKNAGVVHQHLQRRQLVQQLAAGGDDVPGLGPVQADRADRIRQLRQADPEHGGLRTCWSG